MIKLSSKKTGVDLAFEIIEYAAVYSMSLMSATKDLQISGLKLPELTDDECYEIAKASTHSFKVIRSVFPRYIQNISTLSDTI